MTTVEGLEAAIDLYKGYHDPFFNWKIHLVVRLWILSKLILLLHWERDQATVAY